MNLTRRAAGRAAFAGLLAAPAVLRSTGLLAAPRVLKISHQFPGGTADQGDFRDRLVRRFASAVQSRTNGELSFEIYPGSSLMKTMAQFSALRRGARRAEIGEWERMTHSVARSPQRARSA